MADQHDVETAIALAIGNIVYPGGPNQPSIAAPANIRIFRGWPTKASLDPDLVNGDGQISVFGIDGTEGNTTRFPSNVWTDTLLPTPTLQWVTNGLSTTLTGAISTPQNVAILAGGKYGIYAVDQFDSLQDVVLKLAASMTHNGMQVTVNQLTITVANVPSISPRVGSVGKSKREVKRQHKDFLISFWMPNPDLRDTLVSSVDSPLAAINFLTLANGESARMYYHSSKTNDMVEKEILWRRDLVYCVEWATSFEITAYQIVIGDSTVVNTADPTRIISDTLS